VGDFAVIREGTLVTYGLGSCVAVCIVDPKRAVGGMLHFMLPSSTDGGPSDDPARFADTGMKVLVDALAAEGAVPRRFRAKLVGGASTGSGGFSTGIGERNVMAAKRLLWRIRVPVDAEETGGALARTVRMEVPSGRLLVHSPGVEDRWL